jgi:chromosome segregation ATPase
MIDNVENLIIEHLRALRSEIQTFRTEMQGEFRDVKARLSTLEVALSGVKRDQAESLADYARQQMSLDQIVERIQRIERRLELSDG